MALRVILVVFALLAADAYFWQGRSMTPAQELGSDFSYQVARHLQPLHP
jgi:hypothetical protein